MGSGPRSSEKDVTIVDGANTAQQCINVGFFEEIELGIVPRLSWASACSASTSVAAPSLYHKAERVVSAAAEV